MISASGKVKPKRLPGATGSALGGGGGSSLVTKPRGPSHLDDLKSALESRDFSKAVAILEVYKDIGQPLSDRSGASDASSGGAKSGGGGDINVNQWLGYAAFHMGDYAKALDVYKEIIQSDEAADSSNYLYMACCYFCLGDYAEAESAALRGPPTTLQNRLLFHIAFKNGNEQKLVECNDKLQETVEDQLSLAAMNFSRTHYQEAADIYKRVLVSVRDYNAINVYVAQCYNKMDYYDFSNEVLNTYLQANPHSAVAINLRACNHFRLFNGKAAESELKVLMDLQSTSYNVENPIVTHNLVVFRGGENALQVFPSLMDVIPEARLNLVVYHLKNDEIDKAYELVKPIKPRVPSEFVLKAVVCAMVGQQLDAREPIKEAQDYFNLIGNAVTEKDTIPGRQCMASAFFLTKQFDEVVKYLSSIKMYFPQDDTFHYLYGISLAATSHWQEAEETLLSVRSEKLKSEFSYTSWLIRSHIMARSPRKAWDMYLRMETSPESFQVLQLIAADCYFAGAFYYSAKAYDVLERLDQSQENWEGKRGACIGVFQQVVAGKEPAESFWDVAKLLETSAQIHAQERPQLSAQAEQIARVLKNWARDNSLKKR